MIETEVLSELASAIVERDWYKTHSTNHSFTASNGDLVYREEVQQEFIEVLDLIEEILNGGEYEKV